METKICSKCLIKQDIENFYIRRSRNNQRKTICKGCESKLKAKKIILVTDLEAEIWKDVIGYEGIYQVSNLARVKRIMGRKNMDNKLINHIIHPSGYCKIGLTNLGIGKQLSLHRLVALAFIPNPENKPQVNHINGIKTDNRVENLEWNTSSENLYHAFKNGLNDNKGIKHSQSKLTEKDVVDIRASNLTPLELSVKYNVLREQIYKILRKERWNHI